MNIQGARDTFTVYFAAVPWEDLDGDWFFTDDYSAVGIEDPSKRNSCAWV